MVVKSNQPPCLRLITYEKPPLPYTSQKNAWFDRDVTYWWIMNLFWPHHLKYQGNVNAILTLENGTFHDMRFFAYPPVKVSH